MTFLSLIAVLAMVYWTTVADVIQRDSWFIGLINRLRALPAINSVPLLPMILALAIPLSLIIFIILANALFNHDEFARNYLFFLYVPILLYSLGRGNFIADVNKYITASRAGDMLAASRQLDELCGRAATEIRANEITDWKTLHTQALKVIAYRDFERTFAVIFWFVIAGAVGALLYRLSVIYREQTEPGSAEGDLADKWLWLIELPAVRLMGLTWAFVGNFDSCPWQESLLDTENSSITILNNSLRGALSAPIDPYVKATVADTESAVTETEQKAADDEQLAEENAQDTVEDLTGIVVSTHIEPAYSFALVKSSIPLYSRSLLFWIGAIAFATLFI
jgi:AmpE protein